jgi:cytoskeletal protein CcmA (bactofilin family)
MAIFSSEKPAFTRTATPSRADASPSEKKSSLLGRDLTFEGTVTGTEPLFVEGRIKGKIDLASDLRIGPAARLEATVHAKNVLVEGTLIGDVSADHKVELVAGADVDGNIRAPKIVVAEGARFRGSVDMGSERPKDQ